MKNGLYFSNERLGAPPKSYRFQSCDVKTNKAFLMELHVDTLNKKIIPKSEKVLSQNDLILFRNSEYEQRLYEQRSSHSRF